MKTNFETDIQHV